MNSIDRAENYSATFKFPSAISTLSHTHEIEIELNQILCKLSH